jgi:hypothetical protein
MKIEPSFVIHSSLCSERKQLVETIVKETGAEVVEAVWYPDDPKKGCRESHKKVAQMAKDRAPNASYLVFEDDCEFVSDRWNFPMIAGEEIDLVYFGVTGYGKFFGQMYSYGTHAMLVSPKVRDLILDQTDSNVEKVYETGAFDHILNKICYDNNCTVWRPTAKDGERWVRQAKGYTSTISGNIR